MNLPKYQCHKVVEAAKIKDVLPGREDVKGPGATLVLVIGEGVSESQEVLSVSDEFAHKHNPEPGMYFVRYEDGYESISPAKAFEDGYTLVGETQQVPRTAFKVRYRQCGAQTTAIVPASDLADAIARVKAKKVNAEFEFGEAVGEMFR